MKVVIIGGGAAGCFASILIASKGHRVVLIEKNEKLGKKIYITGKGRCNLTNAVVGNDFLKNVVTNQKFIMSSLVRFNSNDTMEYFKELGVPLKIERGNRVFPESDKASDITRAMERRMKTLGVEVMLETKVKEIKTLNNAVSGVVLSDGKELMADAVIVATGGKSYSSTGSTGDGYDFAKATGHRIVEPVAALSAMLSSDKALAALSGLSLKNVRLKAIEKNKVVYETEVGEMLFTHEGISGPLALTISSHINRILPQNVKICIDFKPGLDDFALFQRINRDIVSLKSKQFSSLLELLLPSSLINIFAARLKINKTKKVSQLSADERKALCTMLKNFDVCYSQLDDIDKAIVTSGGVNVKDIKPKSMESKIISKLYFIGEVIDVDAHTGGFNLQLAFSTAASCASDF